MFPNPGIAYIKSATKAFFKDEVNILCEDYKGEIKEGFDLVAVSFHSFSVKTAIRIRDNVKCKLICGGHHPSALPEQMIEIGYDQVVIGEGENIFIDIILGNEDKIVQSGNEYFNINTYPFPDYTGLNWDKNWGVPIISSRGCVFQCNFCASQRFWNKKWYSRNPDNVIEELKKTIQEGHKTWIFEDDNFTLNKERAINICKEIKKLTNGTLDWQCVSRAESLVDDELCIALKDAGCYKVWLGIESLSQDSLDRCNKNTTVEKMCIGMQTANKHDLKTVCQFILGLPGDTEDNIKESSSNIKKYRLEGIATNFAWILPKTKIWEEAKKRGFNDEAYLEGGDLTYNYERSIDELIEWKKILLN